MDPTRPLQVRIQRRFGRWNEPPVDPGRDRDAGRSFHGRLDLGRPRLVRPFPFCDKITIAAGADGSGGLDSVYTRKWSATSLCSGILAGLVGITPAAGYVGTPSALAIGFVTAVVSNYATGLKILLKVDDAVDTFALHAVGGFT